jgi:uncharacterized protein (DUF488 family)
VKSKPGDNHKNETGDEKGQEDVRAKPRRQLAVQNKQAGGIEGISTVGHSTRSVDDFIELLRAHSISVVADVRQFPGSRRYPQFNKEALAKSLAGHGIKYVHLPELGGRRKAKKDSVNTAWRHEAFRGYADYMDTPAFADGIRRLIEMAKDRTAIMCAEAVWWRCHRSLIADYLKAKGIEVLHIIDQKKVEPHPFTSAARIVNGELSYR